MSDMAAVERVDLRMKLAMQVIAAQDRSRQFRHADWAQLAGEAAGLDRPVPLERVSEWMDGTAVPSFEFMMALGEIAGYKPHVVAHMLYGNEQTIHDVTREDYVRVHARTPSKIKSSAP